MARRFGPFYGFVILWNRGRDKLASSIVKEIRALWHKANGSTSAEVSRLFGRQKEAVIAKFLFNQI